MREGQNLISPLFYQENLLRLNHLLSRIDKEQQTITQLLLLLFLKLMQFKVKTEDILTHFTVN